MEFTFWILFNNAEDCIKVLNNFRDEFLVSTSVNSIQRNWIYFNFQSYWPNGILFLQENNSQQLHFSTQIGHNRIPGNTKIQIYKSKKVHIGDVNYYVNNFNQNDTKEEKNKKDITSVACGKLKFFH